MESPEDPSAQQSSSSIKKKKKKGTSSNAPGEVFIDAKEEHKEDVFLDAAGPVKLSSSDPADGDLASSLPSTGSLEVQRADPPFPTKRTSFTPESRSSVSERPSVDQIAEIVDVKSRKEELLAPQGKFKQESRSSSARPSVEEIADIVDIKTRTEEYLAPQEGEMNREPSDTYAQTLVPRGHVSSLKDRHAGPHETTESSVPSLSPDSSPGIPKGIVQQRAAAALDRGSAVEDDGPRDVESIPQGVVQARAAAGLASLHSSVEDISIELQYSVDEISIPLSSSQEPSPVEATDLSSNTASATPSPDAPAQTKHNQLLSPEGTDESQRSSRRVSNVGDHVNIIRIDAEKLPGRSTSTGNMAQSGIFESVPVPSEADASKSHRRASIAPPVSDEEQVSHAGLRHQDSTASPSGVFENEVEPETQADASETHVVHKRLGHQTSGHMLPGNADGVFENSPERHSAADASLLHKMSTESIMFTEGEDDRTLSPRISTSAKKHRDGVFENVPIESVADASLVTGALPPRAEHAEHDGESVHADASLETGAIPASAQHGEHAGGLGEYFEQKTGDESGRHDAEGWDQFVMKEHSFHGADVPGSHADSLRSIGKLSKHSGSPGGSGAKKYTPGDRVMVDNFQLKPELNGKRGVVREISGDSTGKVDMYHVEFDTGEKVKLPASKLAVDVNAELAEFEQGLQSRNDQFLQVQATDRRASIHTDTGTEGVDDDSPVLRKSRQGTGIESGIVSALKAKGLAAGDSSGKGSGKASSKGSPNLGPATKGGKGAPPAPPSKGKGKSGKSSGKGGGKDALFGQINALRKEGEDPQQEQDDEVDDENSQFGRWKPRGRKLGPDYMGGNSPRAFDEEQLARSISPVSPPHRQNSPGASSGDKSISPVFRDAQNRTLLEASPSERPQDGVFENDPEESRLPSPNDSRTDLAHRHGVFENSPTARHPSPGSSPGAHMHSGVFENFPAESAELPTETPRTANRDGIFENSPMQQQSNSPVVSPTDGDRDGIFENIPVASGADASLTKGAKKAEDDTHQREGADAIAYARADEQHDSDDHDVDMDAAKGTFDNVGKLPSFAFGAGGGGGGRRRGKRDSSAGRHALALIQAAELRGRLEWKMVQECFQALVRHAKLEAAASDNVLLALVFKEWKHITTLGHLKNAQDAHEKMDLENEELRGVIDGMKDAHDAHMSIAKTSSRRKVSVLHLMLEERNDILLAMCFREWKNRVVKSKARSFHAQLVEAKEQRGAAQKSNRRTRKKVGSFLNRVFVKQEQTKDQSMLKNVLKSWHVMAVKTRAENHCTSHEELAKVHEDLTLERNNAVEDAKKIKSQYDAINMAQQTEKAKLHKKNAEVDAIVAESTEKCSKLESDLKNSQEDAEELKKRVKDTEEALSKTLDERDKFEQELQKSREEVEALEKALEEAEGRASESDKLLQESEERVQKWQGEAQVNKDAMIEAQNDVSAKIKDLTKVDEEKEDLIDQLNELDKMKAENEALKKQLASAEQNMTEKELIERQRSADKLQKIQKLKIGYSFDAWERSKN